MLAEIARRLSFNYTIRIAADAAYGKEDENGQWSGIIGELSRRVNRLHCCQTHPFESLFRRLIWV
jgi:hypothetical protein